jgi:hypothetical protein
MKTSIITKARAILNLRRRADESSIELAAHT